ncbi:MAG TPA: DUF2911 domain-containing protein [Chitinophagaceae bacterium]|nr:DUF2911 domain-containing protein [Chitinophagaceae bacterium]
MKITGGIFIAFLLLGLCSCKNGKEKKETGSKNVNKEDSINKSNPQTAVNPYDPIDISPMDMTYYPAEYPKLKMTKAITAPPVARVIYSRPHLQGRQLFHDILKYGEAWRLGANESTELQLYRDVTIQNKKVKAGRYVLYCIPQPDKWTIILNSNIDSWGLQPDSTKDIAHFDVPVKQTNNHLEYFTIIFEKTDSGADLLMAWDNLEARLPINF